MAGINETRVPVLIVGAGPSGLFAAVELARHGVRARLVERELCPPEQARATALQPGTLEILAQAGVIDQILAASVQLRFARVFDAALKPVAETAFAGVGCPWEFQCSLPQWRTEQILAARFTEAGGSVERGIQAVSLQEHDDGVRVKLRHADGTPEIVEAGWVIGAGGAHSVTRESMDSELTGETYPGTALVADVKVSCDLPRDGSALIASAGGYVLLAPLPDERWITFIGDLGDNEVQRLRRNTSSDAVAASIGRRVTGALELRDVGWAATFRMQRRRVPRLADKRRFLLGDAGHLSSPFGGEGLNSGLHDGHNLAWKLALELRGHARPALVDSYASERGAAARHVLEISDRLHELAHGAVESARTGVFAPPPSAEHSAALARSRAMLDVSYADSPLTGHYRGIGQGEANTPRPGDRYPEWVALTGTHHHLLLSGDTARTGDTGLARLRSRWAGLMEVVTVTSDQRAAGLAPPGRAILVRPDGHIGFVAAPADLAGLDALDAHLGSYLIPA